MGITGGFCKKLCFRRGNRSLLPDLFFMLGKNGGLFVGFVDKNFDVHINRRFMAYDHILRSHQNVGSGPKADDKKDI